MPPLNSANHLAVPPIQQQIMSNWCWAACTLYVCRIYQTHQGLTQRQFVARALNRPICASNFPDPNCNVTFDLGRAFQMVNHIRPDPPVERPLSPQEIIDIFDHGPTPIGCQMRFPNFGHAVVIADIRIDSPGKLFLVIADPGSGSINTVPYEIFRNNYQGHDGSWTRTYLTQ